MKYTFNMSVLGNTFVMPSIVVDKYIKIATETQLKVLLFLMRNISQEIDSSKIADALSLPKSEVEDALLFWSQRELLNCEQVNEQDKKPVIINSSLPSRTDVIKRGLEDENLKFLLREAQLKFGRNLKQNESQLLVSLYDDYDMKVSVILLLLGYAAREGKCNLSFVKKTAAEWLENGVETVEAADELIAKQAKQNLAWSIVQNAFGIDRRKPSTKELELSNIWINEWKISVNLLKAAYDTCIDSKAKLSMPYIAKIIEQWHKEGVTSADEIKKNQASKPQVKNDYAGYDLDQYEKMLKQKIKERGN
ncbi:MAG: DnaD domain protein [Ruminococcaceae bacterium]|nr:DnaD domain protein [Oscillospiraceae bacterium]